MKKVWCVFWTCMLVCVVLAALIFGIRACVRYEPEYTYCLHTADVSYVYEGDTVVNHYIREQWFAWETRKENYLNVVYKCPAGYINRLVITQTVYDYIDDSRPETNDIELFYVPDKRFMVVDIKSTVSEMKTAKGYPEEVKEAEQKDKQQ